MAPARTGDTIVAGVRWTGSDEPSAPPVMPRTAARTRIAATGRPIASHRRLRRADASAAGPGSRLMRSWARSAFFASMAPILTPPAGARRAGAEHIKLAVFGTCGGGRGSRPGGFGRRAPQHRAARRGRLVARRAFGRRRRGRRRRGGDGRQALSRHHEIDLLAGERLALEPRGREALELGAVRRDD